jgi:hypothetical protein
MSSPPLAFPILDSLIGQFEGFGKPGTPATLNNNPGNIISGPFAESHGATGAAGNFAIFPDVATGLAAEDALVKHYANNNASIADLINAWSPPTAPGNSPDATQNYINFISGKLGVPADTPIDATAGLKATETAADKTSGIAGTIAGMVGKGALDYMFPGLGIPGVGATWGRIGAFLVGLILVAGGVYLFKPVQEVVNKTAKAAIVA